MIGGSWRYCSQVASGAVHITILGALPLLYNTLIYSCAKKLVLIHSGWMKNDIKGTLNANANAIMVVHNHQSGNPKPSRAEKALTIKLIQAGNISDVDAASAAFPKEKNICTSKVYSLSFSLSLATFRNISQEYERF